MRTILPLKSRETAKKIAKGYNIFVIEGIPQEKEQATLLRDEIQRRLTEKIAEDRKKESLPPAEIEVIHQWIIRHGTSTDVFRNRKGKFVKQPGVEETTTKAEPD